MPLHDSPDVRHRSHGALIAKPGIVSVTIPLMSEAVFNVGACLHEHHAPSAQTQRLWLRRMNLGDHNQIVGCCAKGFVAAIEARRVKAHPVRTEPGLLVQYRGIDSVGA